MIRSNSKEFKNRIHSYLMEVTEDTLSQYEGGEYEELKALPYNWQVCKKFLQVRFNREYGWNIKRVGRYNACVEWLQGLALNIVYWETGAAEKLKELFSASDKELEGIIYRRSPKMRSPFEALCRQLAQEIAY